MNATLLALTPLQVMLGGVLYFAVLYFGVGGFNLLLTRVLLPRLGYGRRIDARPVPPAQRRREFGLSVVSILIFGLGLIVPWGFLTLGWARVAEDPSWWRIVLELAVLALWNELHFYVNHRLLHTRPLRRFHVPHHRSLVTTPWSTYSFHPVEALMLGSVPLIPMLLHDFSFTALALLPLFSIVINNLGHSNYEFSAREKPRGWQGASRRHHLHHTRYHGNYGFLAAWPDRLFRSALREDEPSRATPRRDRPAAGANHNL